MRKFDSDWIVSRPSCCRVTAVASFSAANLIPCRTTGKTMSTNQLKISYHFIVFLIVIFMVQSVKLNNIFVVFLFSIVNCS